MPKEIHAALCIVQLSRFGDIDILSVGALRHA